MTNTGQLVTEAREKGRNNISKGITLNDRLADALTAVSAERDTAIRDLDAGFAESDHLSAKYYQRMRDAEREQIKAEAERDRLHKAVTEALACPVRIPERMPLVAWPDYKDEVRRIPRAALEQEGDGDE